MKVIFDNVGLSKVGIPWKDLSPGLWTPVDKWEDGVNIDCVLIRTDDGFTVYADDCCIEKAVNWTNHRFIPYEGKVILENS
jgi:hypothetical protein